MRQKSGPQKPAAEQVIEDYLERRPDQLSDRQRQQVATGRAIVRNPTAFLLDEPLSTLDAELRISMRAELSALHQRLKTTMISVAHDQTEAMTLADRIVMLRKGRVEQNFARSLRLPCQRLLWGGSDAPSMSFLSGTVSSISADSTAVKLPSEETLNVPRRVSEVTAGQKIEIVVRGKTSVLLRPKSRDFRTYRPCRSAWLRNGRACPNVYRRPSARGIVAPACASK